MVRFQCDGKRRKNENFLVFVLRVDCRTKIIYLVFLVDGKSMVRVFVQKLGIFCGFCVKNFKTR